MASKPSSPLPQPSWKTSTSTPYAAATESRFSSTALTAMTSDLNVTSISRNASSSTNANTSGAVVLIWPSKSRVWAVMPVTATSASSREPTVAGTMSSRSASRAALDGPSLPFPATGMETTATVPSGLTLTSTGWFITSVRHGGVGQLLDLA